MTSFGGPPPAAPPGWQVSWSDQHNQWYYVNQATGASQWEPPFNSANPNHPGMSPQPSYHAPNQQPYHQQNFASPAASAQNAAPASTERMGKLSNLDPKAQTALAVGGGMVAGAFLEHEISEFAEKPFFSHHGHHHHVLGSMAGLIGSAGAGALGARLFGKKTQAQAPQAPTFPVSQPGGPAFYPQAHPPPAYPGHAPTPPGDHSSGSNWGKYAVGGAAGAATALGANQASNYFAHHQQPQQQGTPPASTAGGSGSMVSPYSASSFSGPPLIIHAATFADKNVTERVKALITPEQRLSIEKLSDAFGDPWPEAPRKAFSVLYQYGERPMEVWTCNTEGGKVDIRNEALANERMAFITKAPGRIISLIWGNESVLSEARLEKLEKDGDLDCSNLGNGGFWPWEPRNLICFFRGANGGIEIAHAREGGTVRLPWNPLAKWS